MRDGIATKDSWGNLRTFTPGHTKTIQLNHKLNAEQTVNLKRGFIPSQMEEKWCVYYDEPYMYFHRSWTGFLMFKVKIEPGQSDGETILTEAEFNTDPNQYTGDEESVQQDIEWLVKDLADR